MMAGELRLLVVADIGPCSTNTTQEAKNKLLMDETLCCSLLVHGEDFCSTVCSL